MKWSFVNFFGQPTMFSRCVMCSCLHFLVWSLCRLECSVHKAGWNVYLISRRAHARPHHVTVCRIHKGFCDQKIGRSTRFCLKILLSNVLSSGGSNDKPISRGHAASAMLMLLLVRMHKMWWAYASICVTRIFMWRVHPITKYKLSTCDISYPSKSSDALSSEDARESDAYVARLSLASLWLSLWSLSLHLDVSHFAHISNT